MLLGRVVNCIVFAIWVSVCAAAPEFIWRGLVIVASHLTLSEVYSAILIALLLAFFVEPLMERIRTKRWDLQHDTEKASIRTAIVALAFGIMAVSVHEAMNAYLDGEQAANHAGEGNLLKALKQVREWALIPLVVTIIWFGVRKSRWLSLPAGMLTCLWVVAVGFHYDWAWRDIVRTAVPCLAITVLGALLIFASWDKRTFLHLASLTSLVALCWLAVLGVAQGVTWLFDLWRVQIYGWNEFGEDFRFYLGWALGLAVAPSPGRAFVATSRYESAS